MKSLLKVLAQKVQFHSQKSKKRDCKSDVFMLVGCVRYRQLRADTGS